MKAVTLFPTEESGAAAAGFAAAEPVAAEFSADDSSKPPLPVRPNRRPDETAAGKSRRISSRTMVNFVLDAALLLVLAGLTLVTVVMRVAFPVATASAGWSVWGLGYDEWSQLQFQCLGIFLLGILVHLMLHWNWVMNVAASRWPWREAGKPVRPDEGIQTLIGVGLLIALLATIGIVTGAAVLMVQSPTM